MDWKDELDAINDELPKLLEDQRAEQRDTEAQDILELEEEMQRREREMPPILDEQGTPVLTREQFQQQRDELRKQFIKDTEHGIAIEMSKDYVEAHGQWLLDDASLSFRCDSDIADIANDLEVPKWCVYRAMGELLEEGR